MIRRTFSPNCSRPGKKSVLPPHVSLPLRSLISTSSCPLTESSSPAALSSLPFLSLMSSTCHRALSNRLEALVLHPTEYKG